MRQPLVTDNRCRLQLLIFGREKAVRKDKKVVVVGLGEVGKPLLDLVSPHYDAIGVDIAPVARFEQVEVMQHLLSVPD